MSGLANALETLMTVTGGMLVSTIMVLCCLGGPLLELHEHWPISQARHPRHPAPRLSAATTTSPNDV